MTPENLNLLPLYILGGIAGFWMIIAISGALPVLAMWKACIEPVSEEVAQRLLRLVLSSGKVTGTWAIEEGFEPTGVFRLRDRLMNPVIVGWRLDQESTYLCAYVFFESRIELDFISCFGNGSDMSTGSTRDGQILPPAPDNWLQSFSVSDASELWAHHQEALEHLKTTSNLQPADLDSTLAEHFHVFMQLQSRYIRSIPFWILRIPYWYFVRRFTRHNKPLAELT